MTSLATQLWMTMDEPAPTARRPSTLAAQAADPAVARASTQFFDEWDKLQALCRRRFPANDNLAHEGLDYIVQQMQEDDWRRVRSWQGSGRFSTYLLTMCARLLTDFSRTRFGHIRMPAWLSEKSDPIWSEAYRLLIVEGYPRVEAANLLEVRHSALDRAVIEQIVSEVSANCRSDRRGAEQPMSIDDCIEPSSNDGDPESELRIGQDELLETLRRLLVEPERAETPMTRRVRALLARLRPALDLSEEDRLFLRLRHIDGVKMKEIVRLLNIQEDPYKRYHKIIASVRAALQQAGLSAFDAIG